MSKGRERQHLLDGRILSEPDKTFDFAYVRSEIQEGDFVSVRGFLAQVMKCLTTALGYCMFEIELLAERPFPEIERDWCMARDAVRLHEYPGLLLGLQM